MLELPALVAGLIFALLAFGLSVTSLLVHWMKRAENPHTAHLESEVAELSETLYAYMKREAARARRAKKQATESDETEIVAPEGAQQEQRPLSLVPPHLASRYAQKIG